jgi:hypothetical protein
VGWAECTGLMLVRIAAAAGYVDQGDSMGLDYISGIGCETGFSSRRRRKRSSSSSITSSKLTIR